MSLARLTALLAPYTAERTTPLPTPAVNHRAAAQARFNAIGLPRGLQAVA